MKKKIDYSRNGLRVLLDYIDGHRKLFAIDLICALAVAVIDLVFPYVSRIAMNRLLPQNLYRTFFTVMGIVIAAFFFKSGLYYIITVVGHRMGVLTESDMRRDLFDHMQQLSCSFFDHNRTGVLLSRVTSDLFDITELSHHGPENIIICSLTIIGSLIIMFTIKWELALALGICLPLSLWFTLSQRVKMKRTNIEVKRKTGEIASAIENSISGIRTAKAFANEDIESEKFEESNALYRGAKVGYYRTMGLFNSGMEFTASIMQVIVITLGGFLIMKNKMDYTELITFTLYVSTFVSPLRKLAQFTEQYMAGTAGVERFLEIMRTEPAVKDRENADILEDTDGNIEIDDVSFSYDNGIPVLKNVSLSIESGKCLALVGPSGGGKTSLCQLIPRFYDVKSGSIRVDGKDIRDYTQKSLRQNIGMIQQDVFMFAGTIKDNILYGRPDATDEEIREAAKLAEIHDEIMQMPDGYDTYIGERGVMLSGGQKQRVSIARVFLKDPKILILDEATSALDTVTEQKIQQSLDRLSKGRTTIIVAHRLSTISGADKIAVIENDCVSEYGTHAELLEKNGLYSRLYRAQELKEK